MSAQEAWVGPEFYGWLDAKKAEAIDMIEAYQQPMKQTLASIVELEQSRRQILRPLRAALAVLEAAAFTHGAQIIQPACLLEFRRLR